MISHERHNRSHLNWTQKYLRILRKEDRWWYKVNDFSEILQNAFKILLLFNEEYSQKRLKNHYNVNIIDSSITKFSHEYRIIYQLPYQTEIFVRKNLQDSTLQPSKNKVDLSINHMQFNPQTTATNSHPRSLQNVPNCREICI